MTEPQNPLDIQPPSTVLDYQEPAPPQPTMRSAAINGALWTFGGYGVGQIVRFAGNLVLARMLLPEVFGLVGIVYSIITGLVMFTDVGLGQAIIQAKRGDDPKYVNTAWTLQVMRGLGITLTVALLSPLLVWIYQEPRLLWVAPLAATTAAVDGLASMSMFTFPKKLRLAEVTIVDGLAQILGVIAMVGWAKFNPTVYSQVFGGVIGAASRTIGSHWINRKNLEHFCLDKQAMAEQLSFGRWIFISSILTFLAMQADRLLLPIGRFGVDKATFGVYYIAVMIVMVPSQVLSRVASRVVFPAFAQTLNAGKELAPVFIKARRLVLTSAGVAAVMFISAGVPIIKFLYPKKYDDAGAYVTLLAIAIFFQVLDSANQAALMAQARTNWTAVTNGVKLFFVATLLFVGLYFYGMHGAIIGIVASDIIKYLISSVACAKKHLPVFKMDLPAIIWFGAIAGVMWEVIGWMEMHNRSAWAGGSSVGAIAGLIAGAIFFQVARKVRFASRA